MGTEQEEDFPNTARELTFSPGKKASSTHAAEWQLHASPTLAASSTRRRSIAGGESPASYQRFFWVNAYRAEVDQHKKVVFYVSSRDPADESILQAILDNSNIYVVKFSDVVAHNYYQQFVELLKTNKTTNVMVTRAPGSRVYNSHAGNKAQCIERKKQSSKDSQAKIREEFVTLVGSLSEESFLNLAQKVKQALALQEKLCLQQKQLQAELEILDNPSRMWAHKDSFESLRREELVNAKYTKYFDISLVDEFKEAISQHLSRCVEEFSELQDFAAIKDGYNHGIALSDQHAQFVKSDFVESMNEVLEKALVDQVQQGMVDLSNLNLSQIDFNSSSLFDDAVGLKNLDLRESGLTPQQLEQLLVKLDDTECCTQLETLMVDDRQMLPPDRLATEEIATLLARKRLQRVFVSLTPESSVTLLSSSDDLMKCLDSTENVLSVHMIVERLKSFVVTMQPFPSQSSPECAFIKDFLKKAFDRVRALLRHEGGLIDVINTCDQLIKCIGSFVEITILNADDVNMPLGDLLRDCSDRICRLPVKQSKEKAATDLMAIIFNAHAKGMLETNDSDQRLSILLESACRSIQDRCFPPVKNKTDSPSFVLQFFENLRLQTTLSGKLAQLKCYDKPLYVSAQDERFIKALNQLHGKVAALGKDYLASAACKELEPTPKRRLSASKVSHAGRLGPGLMRSPHQQLVGSMSPAHVVPWPGAPLVWQ